MIWNKYNPDIVTPLTAELVSPEFPGHQTHMFSRRVCCVKDCSSVKSISEISVCCHASVCSPETTVTNSEAPQSMINTFKSVSVENTRVEEADSWLHAAADFTRLEVWMLSAHIICVCLCSLSWRFFISDTHDFVLVLAWVVVAASLPVAALG